MTDHAFLSPSAAHRWLTCTAAPKYEQQFPDGTSSYAEEGTLAHKVAELKLRKYAIEPMSPRAYHTRLNKLKRDPLWQNEMDDHTDTYLDYIKKVMLQYPTQPHVVAEKRLDLNKYAAKCFGTADCLILAGDTIHVIDFKYGQGVPVDAKENPQMRLYALGALEAYQFIYSFTKVSMAIVQPRINNISEYEQSVDSLTKWGLEVVKPAASKALNGLGSKFQPGEHCRFCRGKLQCRARNEYYAGMKTIVRENKDATQISMEMLSRYIPLSEELKSWADDIKAYALTCCLDGMEVPGYKAVEGKGRREFTDQDEAFKVLIKNKYAEAILYERVPLTLAQAEKVVGPKRFGELVGSYIIKAPGKPALAPVTDKRPAITNKVKAKDVFKNLEVENNG